MRSHPSQPLSLAKTQPASTPPFQGSQEFNYTYIPINSLSQSTNDSTTFTPQPPATAAANATASNTGDDEEESDSGSGHSGGQQGSSSGGDGSGSSGGGDGSSGGSQAPLPMPLPANTTMTPAVALAAKQAQQGGGMMSWVVCSMQLSNITDFQRMAKDWRSGSMSALITRTAGLGPGQVEVMTSANVSLGVRVAGAELASNPSGAAKGLRAAFAELALGFDPSLLVITPVPPPEASPPPRAVAFDRNARRRLRRQLREAFLDSDGAQDGALSDWRGWNDTAYAAFTGLSPSSVQMLTKAMQMSCGTIKLGEPLPGGWGGRGGLDDGAMQLAQPLATHFINLQHDTFTSSPNQTPPGNCTAVFAQQLATQNIPLDWARILSSTTLVKAPTVTINVLIAAGFTQEQFDAGKSDDLVRWLGDWRNVRGALAAAGLDAYGGTAAAWLQRPEVIYGTQGAAAAQQAQKAAGISTAIAVGLAVPLGLCLLALGGVVGALVLRRRRQVEPAPAGAAGEDGSPPAAGARRRSSSGADDSVGDASRRQVRASVSLWHSWYLGDAGLSSCQACLLTHPTNQPTHQPTNQTPSAPPPRAASAATWHRSCPPRPTARSRWRRWRPPTSAPRGPAARAARRAAAVARPSSPAAAAAARSTSPAEAPSWTLPAAAAPARRARRATSRVGAGRGRRCPGRRRRPPPLLRPPGYTWMTGIWRMIWRDLASIRSPTWETCGPG